jgi:maltooligosyltrehalose synthase
MPASQLERARELAPYLDRLGVTGFVSVVSWNGVWSSLAQLVLKAAVPGVPDFYQGTDHGRRDTTGAATIAAPVVSRRATPWAASGRHGAVRPKCS